jgi:hypothetical protein
VPWEVCSLLVVIFARTDALIWFIFYAERACAPSADPPPTRAAAVASARVPDSLPRVAACVVTSGQRRHGCFQGVSSALHCISFTRVLVGWTQLYQSNRLLISFGREFCESLFMYVPLYS